MATGNNRRRNGNGRNSRNDYDYRPSGYDQQYDDYGYDGYDDGYNDGYGYDGYDDGYYDDGYYDDDYGYDDSYYDDGYYDDGYGYQEQPSMAARASGKQNPELYGYRSSRPRQPAGYGREPAQRPVPQPSRKRRKKRHPFRSFLVFLLILGALGAGAYFLLFQAPEQSEKLFYDRKENFYNILICATDEEEMRTDTIMIATLDRENDTIALTSIPRDTIVDNGQAVPKINGVYGIAGGGASGAEALMDQVEVLLGFRPDGYAVVNYQIFKDLVDAMGGVEFDVPMDMEVDNANDPDDVLYISAGEQVLDGTMALGVCRYRYGYMMADLQRVYVQQSFLKAMVKQAVSPKKLLRFPAMYQAVMDNVLTDLSGGNIRYLALQLLLAGTDDIQQNTLPGEGVDYNGASCYGLYGGSVLDLVNDVLNPFEEDISQDEVHILTVSGGMLVESTQRGTAFDASAYEY
ncbi:MAG: LCP family protein [Oscillospiraceae bacterium]|nr:LCP family protein [Oscillospiraceae bacterium]